MRKLINLAAALAILAMPLSMASASFSDANARADCSIGSACWIKQTACTKGRGKCR
ncbi:MAG: hypothetical protein ACRCTI_05940 [Beijerinckiaceae bacterium]